MTGPATASRARSDSIIGAQMRIDGHIDFAGSLRIHGTVHGDITGTGDPEARVIVAESGSVAGAVRASHIVVQGRIDGPLSSDRSIDVFPRGRCTGGAQYNALSVREGGVVDGMLQLVCSIEDARPRGSKRGSGGRTRRQAAGDAPAPASEGVASGSVAVEVPDLAPARRRGVMPWIIAGLVAALAVAWALRGPGTSVPHPPATLAPAPAVKAEPVPPTDPSPPAPQSLVVPAVPSPSTASGAATKPLPSAKPSNEIPGAAARIDDPSSRIVAIEGASADKPAGTVFLITREATVIHRRKRSEAGSGLRIEVARGRNISLQVGRDEVLRVASGHDIDLFFQGRKLPQSTIEAGAWMSFVPVSRAAPSGEAPPIPAPPAGTTATQPAPPG